MFSSYTAEQLARTYELADRHGVNLLGSVTWAFEFEGQPYFDGFRDLATNGIDKPVLNVFRMLGQMRGDRVSAPRAAGRCRSTRCATAACAARRTSRRSRPRCPVSHRARLELSRRRPARAAADVTLTIEGLPAGRPTLTHYRVDQDHSNAYTVWKAMGSPQTPTAAQRATLEKAGELQMLTHRSA